MKRKMFQDVFYAKRIYFFHCLYKNLYGFNTSLLAGEFPHPKMVYHASGDKGA